MHIMKSRNSQYSYHQIDNNGDIPHSQTYEQYRTSREEKIIQIKEVNTNLKERELLENQKKLDHLISRINNAKSALAEEERKFLNEKESLMTIMNRVVSEAEAKSSESKVKFFHNMESMRQMHEIALQKYAKSMEMIQVPEIESEDSNTADRTRSGRMKLVPKYEKDANDFVEGAAEEQHDYIYSSRIIDIESKKKEIHLEIKEKKQMNKSCVTELTQLLDNQDEKFHMEIEALKIAMQKSEQKYQNEVGKLSHLLEREKSKHTGAIEKWKEKIAKLQEQINEIEKQFKEKQRLANIEAEKLKASLVNVNIKKNQLIEIERQKYHEKENIINESYLVQKNIAKATKEMEQARKESTYLRHELSSKIGPRRSASLFE